MSSTKDRTHLDIMLFRDTPDVVRQSQQRRCKDVGVVDQVIDLDVKWRQLQDVARQHREDLNKYSKAVGVAKRNKEDCTELMAQCAAAKAAIPEADAAVEACKEELVKLMNSIGNIVHDSVPGTDDEANNELVRAWGEKLVMDGVLNHVSLVQKLAGADIERGTKVAGGRGYFLMHELTLLNHALQSYGLHFLSNEENQYIPVQPPYYMLKQMMAGTAQLSSFDEELYRVAVSGSDAQEERDAKYLIATSEQPISCLHADEVVEPKDCPIRYAGISTCFRREVGKHGVDSAGLFRLHQFEKVEQFVLTSPDGNESWMEFERMLALSEKFFQSLGIPYRLMKIVAGALNNAAAAKIDIEGWFPGSNGGNGEYRELVSCSNCTDYQSRRLFIKYGQKKQDQRKASFVHMLNSTLCATERTMCCLLENNQTPEGVRIPDVLVPYMGGRKFIAFRK